MKTKLIFVLLVIACTLAKAQNPSYQEKLFYTCKVWGFAKYYHSRLTNNEVNWDSVLVSYLPEIKESVTTNDFNDKLLNMLNSAGAMKIATTASPDTLSTELKTNLKKDWFSDNLIRDDIKNILDTIYNNFRPKANCWINTSGSTGTGFFSFPKDDPIMDSSFTIKYPNEFERIKCIYKYWNIINYFNPYNDILFQSWDSTLLEFIEQFAETQNYQDFFYTFKRMTAKLEDAHVDGLTWSTSFPSNIYTPKLILRYTPEGYAVVKSGYSDITKGDVILSIDGKSTADIEDSLSKFISVGNPNVLRREVYRKILRANKGSLIEISYKDSTNNIKNASYERNYVYYPDWYKYYPNEELDTVKWKKLNENIGYVHMGNLLSTDIMSMYNDLKTTDAIIFDVRNYPNGTAWKIAELMFPNSTPVTRLLIPSTKYPGTFQLSNISIGIDGNINAYLGKVIILCNQETQSQAEYTCMILRAMPNAVVVGSQTAGADGDITGFNISSGFPTGFSSIGVYYPDGTPTQRIGIIPDSVVYQTPLGIRQGRDEVLEKALEIASGFVSVKSESELNINNSITLYPNPTDDYIIFEVSGNIKIIDIMGRELWKGKVISGDKINVSEFNPGMYYVISTDESITGKFLINK
jgi:C-terminal processing protease CtpA/Prc